MARDNSKTTMGDVAAQAGVSQMTVSRVLNKTGKASDSVRERVEQAARDLGYVHNRLATGLRTRSTPLVAVVMPTLGNRVFSEVLSGVNDALAQAGLRAVFGVTEYDEDHEDALVRDLLSWQPRGILLSGLEHSDATRAAIHASGIRVVEVMDIDGDPISVAVGMAQAEAGRAMARHLLERGHRRFAYLGAQGGNDRRAAKRLEGFAETVRAGGGKLIVTRVADAPSSMPLGRQMTADLLTGSRPDAVYYSNDDLAAGGLMHCLAHGIEVPRQVALAGFNGLEFAEALPLRLTTTRTPRYTMGFEAGRVLAQSDAEFAQTPRCIDLGSELVIGQTS